MIRFCNDCIHFGVCMGFSNCKSFERRENANMRITGYESDNGKLTAVIVTDETRNLYDKRFEPERQRGECNQCRYYEGVHGVQGHAPCSFWKIGGVLWNDFCSRYEKGGEAE